MDAWTIKRDPDQPGRWTYDYDFAPPPPAPITTISWRLVHMIADNEIYWEYAFGPPNGRSPDLAVPKHRNPSHAGLARQTPPITDRLRTATTPISPSPAPVTWVTPRSLQRSCESF